MGCLFVNRLGCVLHAHACPHVCACRSRCCLAARTIRHSVDVPVFMACSVRCGCFFLVIACKLASVRRRGARFRMHVRWCKVSCAFGSDRCAGVASVCARVWRMIASTWRCAVPTASAASAVQTFELALCSCYVLACHHGLACQQGGALCRSGCKL